MKPISFSNHWRSSEPRPLLLGHRGASHAAPENTLASFELAVEEGAEGVELDVRLNASGQVVVLHDETLTRVTCGRDSRAIATLHSSESTKLRLQDGETLPSLADTLSWATARQSCLNIELKDRGRQGLRLAQAVARQIAQHPQSIPLLLISSFTAPLIWALRWHLPQVPGAWLFESSAVQSLPWLPRAAAVHPAETQVSQTGVERWKRAGFRVHAWTVDSPHRARQLSELGVDGLITNSPARVRKALLSSEPLPQR